MIVKFRPGVQESLSEKDHLSGIEGTEGRQVVSLWVSRARAFLAM